MTDCSNTLEPYHSNHVTLIQIAHTSPRGPLRDSGLAEVEVRGIDSCRRPTSFRVWFGRLVFIVPSVLEISDEECHVVVG
jgi:hypothetical protein